MCQKITVSFFKDITIPNTILCNDASAGGDSCTGDSGAGLFHTNENQKFVVGMVSAGGRDCGESAIPSFNTKVSEYVDWIKNCVQDGCDVKKAETEQRLVFTGLDQLIGPDAGTEQPRPDVNVAWEWN